MRQNAPVKAVRLVVSALLAGAVACQAPPAPSEVTGLITAIERDAAGTIVSFTVEDAGTPYEVRIDPGRDYGFDLEHLAEHRAQRVPVRVTLADRDGTPTAVQILDA